MALWIDFFIYDILEETMVPHANDNTPHLWPFQRDNDPKSMSKLVK